MSTSTTDARPHAVAICAAVTASLQSDGATWECFDRDQVPPEGQRPDLYAVLDLSRRPMDNLWALAPNPQVGWRATVWAVGSTLDEVRWVQHRIDVALSDVSLDLGAAGDTTPLAFEAGEPVVFDEGEYSAPSIYTYRI